MIRKLVLSLAITNYIEQKMAVTHGHCMAVHSTTFQVLRYLIPHYTSMEFMAALSKEVLRLLRSIHYGLIPSPAAARNFQRRFQPLIVRWIVFGFNMELRGSLIQLTQRHL